MTYNVCMSEHFVINDDEPEECYDTFKDKKPKGWLWTIVIIVTCGFISYYANDYDE